jgi:Holliday junction resolvase RusA-like endonuclease
MKKTVTFMIEGRLPGMNDLISTARGKPWWSGRNMKKKAMHVVACAIDLARIPKFINPVTIHMQFVESNARRDRDNVTSGGSKIIMDTLTHKGIIPNDTRRWVTNITHATDVIDKEHPRVMVSITETEDP